MDYTIQQQPVFFVLTVSGKASPEGFAEMCDELFTRPGWQPGTPLLIDFRNTSFSLFNVRLIKESAEITRRNADQWRHCKMALLLTTDLGRGLGNMWLSYSADVEFEPRIFTDIGAALHWLGEEPAQPITAA